MSSFPFRSAGLLCALLLTVGQMQAVHSAEPSGQDLQDNSAGHSESQIQTASWQASIVGKPVIVRAKLPDGTMKSYMWYAVNGSSTDSTQVDTNIGLAISDDGVNFSPLPSAKSPYSRDGEVLAARQAFKNSSEYSAVHLGEPVITRAPEGLRATFYKVAFKGTEIAEAGIARAHSKDGVHWQFESENPMTIRVTGHSSSVAIESRLAKLSEACAEM